MDYPDIIRNESPSSVKDQYRWPSRHLAVNITFTALFFSVCDSYSSAEDDPIGYGHVGQQVRAWSFGGLELAFINYL